MALTKVYHEPDRSDTSLAISAAYAVTDNNAVRWTDRAFSAMVAPIVVGSHVGALGTVAIDWHCVMAKCAATTRNTPRTAPSSHR